VWWNEFSGDSRNQEFFLIALSHDNLINYYNVNFLLIEEYKYSLTELENMIPWEREIYLALLAEHVKKKNEMRKTELSKYRR
jgi:hypothetical protein